MANKKIIDVDTLSSLADSDSLFVNSDGELKQVAVEDAGLMRMDLLWENAAPTSEFAAQTIELDLSEYSTIIMTFKSYVSYDYKGITAIFKKGDAAVVCLNSTTSNINAGSLYAANRLIEGSSDSGITVGKAVYMIGTATAVTGNGSLLPYQIYGIKGIQSNLPNYITFSIGGTSCTALEGMTWAEWVSSEYNTYSSGTIGALGSVVSMGQYTLILADSVVSPTDIIINNGVYGWSGGGGND